MAQLSPLALLAVVCWAAVAIGWAFSPSVAVRRPTTPVRAATEARSSSSDMSMSASSGGSSSRRAFLSGVAGLTGAVGMGGAVWAAPKEIKNVDPALLGTKDDPNYVNCLSECLYFCTKAKGEQQQTRGECFPGCKADCKKFLKKK